MQDWTPYLTQLLGDHPAAAAQARDLVTIREMLARPPEEMAVAARLGLLEWVSGLDSVRRTFLLPWTLGLLADPSAVVVRAMLRDVRELADDAEDPVLDALEPLAGAAREPRLALERALEAVRTLVEAEAARELEGDFSAVLALRTPVLGLGALLGLTRWAAARSGDGSLAAYLQELVADEGSTRFRAALRRWAVSGPMFLRYLAVTWIGEAQLPLAAGETARDLLRKRYEVDPDPVVAAAAVHGYAARVPAADLKPTVDYLYDELASFKERRLSFDPARDPRWALRGVSVAVFRALGKLAAEHYPDPRPLARFTQVLRTPPSERLDLLDTPLDAAARDKAARAALLLRDTALQIRVRPGRGGLGAAGFEAPVRLTWKKELRAQEHAGTYWARVFHRRDLPAGDAATADPEKRAFHVFAEAPADDEATVTLLGLVTPTPHHLAAGTRPRAQELKKQLEPEVDERGPWITAACDLVTSLLRRMRALDDEPARSLFAWLAQVAVASNLLGYRPEERKTLKNTVVRLFLNELSDPQVFALLRGSEGPDLLTTRFVLWLAAKAAQRSLPDAPESRWVDGNLDLIQQVAREPGDLYTAAGAAVLLHGLPPWRRGSAGVSFEITAQKARITYPAAACFLGDEELRDAAAQAEEEADAAGEDGRAEDFRLAVAAEILARALERGSPAGAQVEAGTCLRKLLPPPEVVPTEDRPADLRPQARRRLLAAYAGCDRPLEGSALRLRDRLVRTASSAELQYFLALRRAGPAAATADPHLFRLLRELLGQVHGAGAATGRRLDSQALEDRLQRRPVLVRELARMAEENPRTFFDRWVGLLPPVHAAARGPVTPAAGTLLPTPATLRRAPDDEVLAVAKAPGDDAGDLAQGARDLLAAFAYLPAGVPEVRCLVRGVRAPAGTLDLFALPPAERAAALEARLEHGPVTLLGRVAAASAGRIEVQIGTGPRHALPCPPGTAPQVDQAVLLEAAWGERELPEKIRLEHLRVAPEGAVHDLRDAPDAAARLRRLHAAAENGGVLLRASVTDRREARTGAIQCRLNTGLRHLYDGVLRELVIYAPPEQAPAQGEEIVVRASEFQFRRVRGREAGLEVRFVPAEAAGDQVLAATLHAVRAENGRRRWTARTALGEVPVARGELTADLAFLHALDRLDDADPVLGTLAREPLPVCVRDGERGSVLAAPPRWAAHDLVVAVAAGQVEAVTVLRLERGQAVLEAHPSGGPEAPAGPPLGWLARVDPGELFDAGSRRPLGADALARGTRLWLEVRHGTLAPDGGYEESEDELGAEWREPFLASVSAAANPAARMRAIFAHGASVDVGVEAEGGLVVREPLPEGIDTPRVISNDAHLRQQPGWTGEAVVADDEWDPFDADYTVRVKAIELNYVKLTADPVADAERLFRLEPGDVFPGIPRLVSRGSTLYVNNVPFQTDPLLAYLFGDNLPDLVRRAGDGVLVTEMKPGKADLTVPPPDLQALAGRGSLRGVVVARAPAGGTEVRARWVEGLLEDEWATSQAEWPFHAPPRAYVQNGDRVEVARERGEVGVRVRFRRFSATVLHRVSVLAAVQLAQGRGFWATLVERGDEDEAWVFAFEDAPCRLVRVPAAALEAEPAGAVPGDRVLFEPVRRGGGGGRLYLSPKRVQEGLLRRLPGARCVLTVETWRDPRDHTYACTLRAPELGSELPPLRLRLTERALPPGITRSQLDHRPFDVTCTVKHYQLRLPEADAADGHAAPSARLELLLVLDAWTPAREVSRLDPPKPSLRAELDREGGRLETSGESVSIPAGTAVRLRGFQGEPVVPLPEAEQTWVPHTGELVPPRWKGRVAVFVDANGEVQASLRRLRPRPLDEWLAARRVPARGPERLERPLLHFGVLEREDREACGDPEPDAETLVLFEAGPGRSFVATPAQLRFKGADFVPGSLKTGDEVIEIAHFREPGGRRGMNIVDVSLGIRHDVELFAGEGGVFFGRLQADAEGVAVVELHGAGFRSRPVAPSQQGRWKLRLVAPPGAEAVQGEISPAEVHYLRFVGADPVAGELRFRRLTDQEAFARSNLVFVRPGEPSPDPNGVWHLRVHPLDGDSRVHCSISDTVFSVRTGRLRALVGRLPGEYLLARVVGMATGHSETRLGLTTVPPRRFPFLLKHLAQRHGRPLAAIVKPSRRPELLELELEPGLNAELPKARIAGRGPENGFAEGDVLFLRLTADRLAVEVADVVPGHLAYLEAMRRPTLLALLWQQPAQRRAMRRRDPEKPLNCSLVGLAQIPCVCRDDVHIEATAPVPQRVLGRGRNPRFVEVTSEVGRDAAVGRLRPAASGPLLEVAGRDPLRLDWREVTFRHAFGADLAAALDRVRWRDEEGGSVRDLSTASVVAAVDPQGRVSLTRQARWPLPPDHLAEQFAEGGKRRLTFVVAGAAPGRIVLEVAPGRYAELPTSLVEPLRDERFAPGHGLTGALLSAGDLVTVERAADREDAFHGIPRFRVVELRPGPTRLLAHPLVTLLQRGPRGPVLGPLAGGIPAEHAEGLLRHLDRAGGGRRPGAARVLAHGWTVDVAKDPPRPGDTVLVAGEPAGERLRPRVLGMEGWGVRWDLDPRDPLQLHVHERRELLLPTLLDPSAEAFLWATVESLDYERRTVLLSRRRQLAAVLPAPGQITWARVSAALSRGELLADLLGVPVTLAAARYCHGAPPLAALEAVVAAGGGALVEVTAVDDEGTLGCTAAYPEPPAGSDFVAQVELAVDAGVFAAWKGARVFVPAAELGWCRLSPEAIRAVFVPGQPLRLRQQGAGARRRFSHLASRDLRAEAESLSRRPADPVYVKRAHVPADGGPVLARSLAGLLMEVRLADDEAMPAAASAYVQEVDPVGRRMLLSLHESLPRRWSFPRGAEPPFALDALAHDVVRARGLLGRAAPFADPAAAGEWLGAQPMLEPSPRNLRLVLEAVHPLSGGDPGWAAAAYGATALAGAVREFHALATGTRAYAEASVPALFALGYWSLLAGDPAAACAPLAEAASRREAERHFDVGFAYARAAYLAGNRAGATRELRSLLESLWSGALATFPLAAPHAASLAPLGAAVEARDGAVSDGDLAALAGVLRARLAGAPEEGSPEAQWRQLWPALAQRELGGGFDRAVQHFFEALRDARSYGFPVHPEVAAAAVQLAAGSGDHEAVVWQLEALRAAGSPAGAEAGEGAAGDGVARFWAAWAAGAPPDAAADRLLNALARLLSQCRWRPACEAADFDAAWEAFRRAPHRWVLEAPRVRIVPAPPDDDDERRGWAARYDAGAALDYLPDATLADGPG